MTTRLSLGHLVILCFAALLGGETPRMHAVTTAAEVRMWVGRGSQEAVLVIDWQDGANPSGFAWGFRWNGTATAEDALLALHAANPRMALATNGSTIAQINYDTDGNGILGNSLFDPDYDSPDKIQPAQPVNWNYYVRASQGDPWVASATSFDQRQLVDGEWHGWSLDDGGGPTPPNEPDAAPLPFSAPLPSGPTLPPVPNGYDGGIAGFIGPDGAGKSPFGGFTNNYVNPVFTAWADTVTEYDPFNPAFVDDLFENPQNALGPVTADNFDIVSLDDMNATEIAAFLADPVSNEGPGILTVQFASPIFDGRGADLAVFENGVISQFDTGDGSVIGQHFGELAYVEVSSNGTQFARFPGVSLTPATVGPFGTILGEGVFNLAGKHVNASDSWGTPFDLADLATDPLVTGGQVDLQNIQYVRLVDIPGSGDFLDALGFGIFDAWLTTGSGGFDAEAIGALNQERTYQLWRAQMFLPGEVSNDLVSGPGADPDLDGCVNLLEYAWGLNPKDSQDTPGPLVTGFKPRVVLTSAGVEFRCFRDSRQRDLVYTVESSTDLSSWSPEVVSSGGADSVASPGSSPVFTEEGSHHVTLKVLETNLTQRRFWRLVVNFVSP